MKFLMPLRLRIALLVFAAAFTQDAMSQNMEQTPKVALQPMAQHIRQVQEALSFLGQPLPAADAERINVAIGAAFGRADEAAAVSELERVLDQYALAIVTINAESRVKVEEGQAKAELEQEGTRLYLVNVINGDGVTAMRQVKSAISVALSRRTSSISHLEH